MRWAGTVPRGQRALRLDSRNDQGPTLIGEVLMRELELERNCLTYPREPVPLPNVFDTGCSPFQVYAAFVHGCHGREYRRADDTLLSCMHDKVRVS